MLGIQDTFVLLAYLLCIASAVLCVAYGAAHWNTSDETPGPADVKWADEQAKAEAES